jgi:predicted ATP-binding protein involved in virulence
VKIINRLQTNHNQTINQICKAVKQLTHIFDYKVETLWTQSENHSEAAKLKKSINYEESTNYKIFILTNTL